MISTEVLLYILTVFICVFNGHFIIVLCSIFFLYFLHLLFYYERHAIMLFILLLSTIAFYRRIYTFYYSGPKGRIELSFARYIRIYKEYNSVVLGLSEMLKGDLECFLNFFNLTTTTKCTSCDNYTFNSKSAKCFHCVEKTSLLPD